MFQLSTAQAADPLHHLGPSLWQVETLIIDSPPPPALSLSSVHSLQPLSTYLVPTEQCCWRRALKDRLDCLGILISPFSLHTSCRLALLCCIFWPLRCFSRSLFMQNCVFIASWLKEKSPHCFHLSTVENRKSFIYISSWLFAVFLPSRSGTVAFAVAAPSLFGPR